MLIGLSLLVYFIGYTVLRTSETLCKFLHNWFIIKSQTSTFKANKISQLIFSSPTKVCYIIKLSRINLNLQGSELACLYLAVKLLSKFRQTKIIQERVTYESQFQKQPLKGALQSEISQHLQEIISHKVVIQKSCKSTSTIATSQNRTPEQLVSIAVNFSKFFLNSFFWNISG